jgi:hypothetical protein
VVKIWHWDCWRTGKNVYKNDMRDVALLLRALHVPEAETERGGYMREYRLEQLFQMAD